MFTIQVGTCIDQSARVCWPSFSLVMFLLFPVSLDLIVSLLLLLFSFVVLSILFLFYSILFFSILFYSILSLFFCIPLYFFYILYYHLDCFLLTSLFSSASHRGSFISRLFCLFYWNLYPAVVLLSKYMQVNLINNLYPYYKILQCHVDKFRQYR